MAARRFVPALLRGAVAEIDVSLGRQIDVVGHVVPDAAIPEVQPFVDDVVEDETGKARALRLLKKLGEDARRQGPGSVAQSLAEP